ncbi:hypothetical protein [Bradyrhizobium sp. LMG 9283]|uniref:hypothetical protein n=1 Tax=Bradyrhizobium sp. LMG 9283 TaxID=592064 RepID=UPI00388DD838
MAFQRQFKNPSTGGFGGTATNEPCMTFGCWLVVRPAGLVCHDMNVEAAMARDGIRNPFPILIAALVSRQIGWAQILQSRG